MVGRVDCQRSLTLTATNESRLEDSQGEARAERRGQRLREARLETSREREAQIALCKVETVGKGWKEGPCNGRTRGV